ncbi:MAG: hypothetical protein V3U65_07805 [Granulosicoccaceae bacterium]
MSTDQLTGNNGKTGTGKKTRALLLALACIAPMALASDTDCNCEPSGAQAEVKNVYPTPVVVDYVLACMASNGNSFTSLHQCSCSIDLIMSKIKHEDFEKVNTIMQVQLDKGQRGIFYRDSHWAKNAVEIFERVQAESTLKCF